MSYELLYNAYINNRESDTCHMRDIIKDFPNVENLLSHVFWANTILDFNGNLQTIYSPLEQKKKFNVVTFNPTSDEPKVVTDEKFWKLQITNHRVLKLSNFNDEESFFRSLSPKNRKKLRWLRNAVPNLGCKIIPITTKDDFSLFEELYCAQFPKYTKGCDDNIAVWKMYEEFIKQNRSFSFILLSQEGIPLAAALGYFNEEGYNYTHLTRGNGGKFDKYSPGYYLTFSIIMKLLAEYKDIKYFFMGPGEYDYKRIFHGESFAIYRYEPKSWWKFFTRIRLAFRCRKERKKFLQNK